MTRTFPPSTRMNIAVLGLKLYSGYEYCSTSSGQNSVMSKKQHKKGRRKKQVQV